MESEIAAGGLRSAVELDASPAASDFQRRADDNEDSLRTRLLAYYKQTSPLIGYYHAKGDLKSVDGLASMDEVAKSISEALG